MPTTLSALPTIIGARRRVARTLRSLQAALRDGIGEDAHASAVDRRGVGPRGNIVRGGGVGPPFEHVRIPTRHDGDTREACTGLIRLIRLLEPTPPSAA